LPQNLISWHPLTWHCSICPALTLGMGAYLGLSCNLRYQLIGGADRWMTERLTTLASATTASVLGRLANTHFGDLTRLFALGKAVQVDPIKPTMKRLDVCS